jgi:hypothetical protein
VVSDHRTPASRLRLFVRACVRGTWVCWWHCWGSAPALLDNLSVLLRRGGGCYCCTDLSKREVGKWSGCVVKVGWVRCHLPRSITLSQNSTLQHSRLAHGTNSLVASTAVNAPFPRLCGCGCGHKAQAKSHPCNNTCLEFQVEGKPTVALSPTKKSFATTKQHTSHA